MNNWFLPNLDEEKVISKAKAGDMLHYHKYQQPCNEKCFKKEKIVEKTDET